jgi:pimeloyl-ACP methyl ester carboxylesterase
MGNGKEICYEGRGTRGPALLLVHAFPLDRRMWRRQLTGLGDLARVVAIDLPGFGQSAPVGDGHQAIPMAELGEQVIGVANALGFDRFVLGGLSMGGYVAQAMLARHRGRLAGLALMDTRLEADTVDIVRGRLADADRVLVEGQSFLAERMLPGLLTARTHEERPDLVEEVRRMILEASREGLAATLRGMAGRGEHAAELAKLTVPTTVIVGAEDELTPPEVARRLAQTIPGSQLAVVPGAGHLASLEQADAVNVALRALLRRAAA